MKYFCFTFNINITILSILLTFLNRYEFFQHFLTFLKLPFWKQIQGYNRRTVSLITENNVHSDMESCYKNVFNIRKVSFIFQKF